MYPTVLTPLVPSLGRQTSGITNPEHFLTQLCLSPRNVYEQLVAAGLVVPQPEKEPPSVPMDYSWAQELGLIRKPASFMSSICDERGEELLYAGMPISDVFKVIDHMQCAIVKLKLKSSRMFVWSLLSCLPTFMTALFPSLYPDFLSYRI